MTTQKEFGDFQTPLALAKDAVALAEQLFGSPGRVVEPTAGLGSFLEAAHLMWGEGPSYEGFEINPDYVATTRARLGRCGISVTQQDFFLADWRNLLSSIGGVRLLVIGNPPWVTNSALGALGSVNLPTKSNFQGLRGFEAKTGKSNFDIAEWMLIQLVEALPESGAIAMLCKTMTARKVLRHLWKTRGGLADASLFRIDAKAHFGVSVDACLFTATGRKSTQRTAKVYPSISQHMKPCDFGLVDGHLVSDVRSYKKYSDIDGGSPLVWRSGVKHDASKVMELVPDGAHFRNGLGERVEIETDFVYPLLKSSDLGNGRAIPRRHVLITQRKTGESTDLIRETAPKTWQYLEHHAAILDARKSSIYKERARFSIFGIGDYSFSPLKVAISGLYKSFRFTVVPPSHGKPTMVDDTCYFVPCPSQDAAILVCSLLNSEPAQQFLEALVFQDSKRPVTTEVLRRISLTALATRLGLLSELNDALRVRTSRAAQPQSQLDLVMESKASYRVSVQRRKP